LFRYNGLDDLDQSFQDIGERTAQPYSIAYIPTNSILDGKYHRIRIEAPNHKGYQVRAAARLFCQGQQQHPPSANASPSGDSK